MDSTRRRSAVFDLSEVSGRAISSPSSARLRRVVRECIPEDWVLAGFIRHLVGVELGVNFDFAAQVSLGDEEP